MTEYRITFKLEEEDRKVVVATDNEGITLEELFMLWVDFAAGCGYVLDQVAMQEMWDRVSHTDSEGVEDTEKLTKAIEALEGVKVFVGGLYPHTEQGTVLVPQLAKAVETLGELKQ